MEPAGCWRPATSRPPSPDPSSCSHCFEPSAAEADPPLVETARRLFYPIKLDVLATDSLGSIASILTPRRGWPHQALRSTHA
jgi:hypothetical protein